MIYAYGICEPQVAIPPPPGRGLGGARLRSLENGDVAAVYSRHRSLRARPVAEQVLTHERVIEAIMARGPVLPLRFGTELDGESQLAAVLAERSEALARALDRVRGHVEMGLRVIPHRPRANDDTAGASGRDVLLARVRDHQRARRIASELHAPLARLAAATEVREYPRPPAILVASYLVAEERIDAFRQQAEELAARQEGVRVLVTGPWPPYSFAAAEGP